MPAYFFTNPLYGLDNFSAHAVEVDGVIYPTAEHAYHAQKFADGSVRDEIRAARSPFIAKTLANEKFRSVQPSDWGNRKVEAMEKILRAKLAQHEEVRDILLSTSNELLIEDSPYDSFWGEGATKDGQNQLGKLWMKLRTELQPVRPSD